MGSSTCCADFEGSVLQPVAAVCVAEGVGAVADAEIEVVYKMLSKLAHRPQEPTAIGSLQLARQQNALQKSMAARQAELLEVRSRGRSDQQRSIVLEEQPLQHGWVDLVVLGTCRC